MRLYFVYLFCYKILFVVSFMFMFYLWYIGKCFYRFKVVVEDDDSFIKKIKKIKIKK